jgi:tetratricopeptide (TPR) repeat protein
MATISLCMIVRNNEDTISNCIKSVKGITDEIIIVDTGSSDKTKIMAAKFTDKIYDFKWIDDFSAAKNFALSKATKEWILALDADEVIAEENLARIKELIESKEYMGYYLIQRQYTNKIGTVGWVSSSNDRYKESKAANGWFENPILRLFKNDMRIKFDGKLHDIVYESIKKIGKICITDIPIHHFGEINRDFSGKADRNIRFLEKQAIEKGDFFTYYQLACELIGIGKTEEALIYLNKSIELNSEYSPSLLNLGGLYINEKKLDKAEKILKKAVELDGSNPDIHNNLGVVYSEKKEYKKAIKKFERAIELNPKSADAFYNLGLVYTRMKRDNEARYYYNKAIELNPMYKEKIN